MVIWKQVLVPAAEQGLMRPVLYEQNLQNGQYKEE